MMDEDYKEFLKALGGRIRELRKQRGWSNRDIVFSLGINDSQWRSYERGGGLRLDSLLRLAGCFQISLSELLDGLGQFPQKSVSSIRGKDDKSRQMKELAKAPAKGRAKAVAKPTKKRSAKSVA